MLVGIKIIKQMKGPDELPIAQIVNQETAQLLSIYSQYPIQNWIWMLLHI